MFRASSRLLWLEESLLHHHFADRIDRTTEYMRLGFMPVSQEKSQFETAAMLCLIQKWFDSVPKKDWFSWSYFLSQIFTIDLLFPQSFQIRSFRESPTQFLKDFSSALVCKYASVSCFIFSSQAFPLLRCFPICFCLQILDSFERAEIFAWKLVTIFDRNVNNITNSRFSSRAVRATGRFINLPPPKLTHFTAPDVW